MHFFNRIIYSFLFLLGSQREKCYVPHKGMGWGEALPQQSVIICSSVNSALFCINLPLEHTEKGYAVLDSLLYTVLSA